MRRLCIVLGDQLDRGSALFDDFDAQRDSLWMAEVFEEATHVWSHKQRIVLFLSAMRHFAGEQRAAGVPVDYLELMTHTHTSLETALEAGVQKHRPESAAVVRPGDYRVLQQVTRACEQAGVPLEIIEDRHFITTPQEFIDWAEDRKQLRMEYWYRTQRRRHEVLMTPDGEPEGGQWNYDADNRRAFGRHGPGLLTAPVELECDAVTRDVIELVAQRFDGHPGSLEGFNWPVTPEQAEAVLQRFLDDTLPYFGDYQDAMWTGEPFLYHSLLASALNLKLLEPMRVVRDAESRYRDGAAPLAAVEGFIRQVLGWREFVRGLYWRHMPDWLEWNALDADADLPGFYWDGDTDMECLRQAIGQTLEHGYAHHIQRLMVTGLFALLYGVKPVEVHRWYLAVYVDAVEWVELPNTLGMSQYADGGIMASKPYVASGKYIKRMSNYCTGCRYDPDVSAGDDACPFTTLFWDFLERHRERLGDNPRMKMMLNNLDRIDDEKREAIRRQAAALRRQYDG